MAIFSSDKEVDFRSRLIFRRLHHSSSAILTLAVFSSAMAVGAMIFNEAQATRSSFRFVADGLLGSSTQTGIIAAATTIMMKFQCESHAPVTGMDHGGIWVPIGLLDISVIEFVVGFVLCNWDDNDHWGSQLTGFHLFILLFVIIFLTLQVWATGLEDHPKQSLKTSLYGR
ncbi:hypothetical protein BGW36DRAFT_362945 [Talaromyces proteolyticus]|uniref:Uncharacterized protein n=1 Tax=Talaromyces proteolyticus TaxID=1131652 RepID=A0AAD4PVY2_9EURO|nr:uncharacterized protein BGW36DRAFT_362945 [Talaromyces proteolyticus]KAH8691918.1 hypothetical protein BGW36DRAFT_362945 [Talaromyces proteolyticus]